MNADTADAAKGPNDAVGTAERDWRIAYDHIGDLYRGGENTSGTAKRIRAHLRETLPGLEASVRISYASGCTSADVSIRGYDQEDLTVREAARAFKRLVDAELKRFMRYEWWPNHGRRAVSLHTHVTIDRALHAAKQTDAPDIESTVSFAEFTRTARAGDILEHVAGVVPRQGPRVAIIAVSSRRLTTRAADGPPDAPPSRSAVQGGDCFTCDGELICFRHSGVADQGGYSLMRWIRER